MSKQNTATTKKKEIPIEWHIPDNIISQFSSHVLVDILENEFKLSFFELKPKIRLDPNDPLPKEVRADCVANIILSSTKIPPLIDALKKQYDQYIKIKSEQLNTISLPSEP